MRLSKEQAETLALVILAGCAAVVLSFVFLVKPRWEAAANSRSQLSQMEADIEKFGRAHKNLANADREKKSLTETIEQGEKTLFQGLEAGAPLSEIFAKAAALVGVKPAYAEQTTHELLAFSEKTSGGTQTTRHYDEVSRMLEMRSVDFFTLCDFLGAVEHANEGLWVSELRIESASLDPTQKSQGTVNANVGLSLLGIREGEPPAPSALAVAVPKNPDLAGKRNPFGPAQERRQTPDDPIASAKKLLKSIRVNGTIGEWVLLQVPIKTSSGKQESQTVSLSKGQTATIEGLRMTYIGTIDDSFLFEATAHGVRFILEADYKGEIRTVREEAMK